MNSTSHSPASKLFKFVLPMALASCLCVALMLGRAKYHSSHRYIFLIWNLFLAWMPLFFAGILYLRDYPPNFLRMPAKIIGTLDKFICLGLLGLWLLFFPNSPYIVSDLMHLTYGNPATVWFDAVLFFCFAITGLQVGLFSLFLIERVMTKVMNRAFSFLIILSSILLSGFGIYMGRVLRLNSWELFTEPIQLFWKTFNAINLYAGCMTAIYAALIAVIYLIFRSGRQATI